MKLDVFDQLEDKVNHAIEIIGHLREDRQELLNTKQVHEAKIRGLEEEVEKLRVENRRIKEEQAEDYQHREELIKKRLKGMLEKLEALEA